MCIRAFAEAELRGKLFINFSADALREIVQDEDDVRSFFKEVNFSLERVVVELTEQPPPEPLGSLKDALEDIRQTGVQLALDDYGTGNANLSLWAALRPDLLYSALITTIGSLPDMNTLPARSSIAVFMMFHIVVKGE